MTESQERCILVAITISKIEQIKSISKLRSRLLDRGFSDEDINVALTEWAKRITE